jgi:hypothetical protein
MQQCLHIKFIDVHSSLMFIYDGILNSICNLKIKIYLLFFSYLCFRWVFHPLRQYTVPAYARTTLSP